MCFLILILIGCWQQAYVYFLLRLYVAQDRFHGKAKLELVHRRRRSKLTATRTCVDLECRGYLPEVGGAVCRADELGRAGLVQRRVQDQRLDPLLSAGLPSFNTLSNALEICWETMAQQMMIIAILIM
jgi:hypothetical protein